LSRRDSIGEEEIPTIVLKPECAIQTLDMFVENPAGVAQNSSPSQKSTDSSENNKDNLLLRVEDADYNASSQTVLYSYDDESFTSFSSASSSPLSMTTTRKRRRRAAYLSATVIKEAKDTKLGMGIAKVRGVLQVTSLRPGCLLADAPFQKGDKLISVNHIPCAKKSVASVAALLKNTTGVLTVVVENQDKEDIDPELVESMILKTTPATRTGLGVAEDNTAQQVKISSINPKGLFSESLLSRRDRILSINNTPCDHLEPTDVAKLICSAETVVTIVARRKMDSAAVVALAC